MLEWLRQPGTASEHKLRLFAVACTRQAWDLLNDPRLRTAVETAERYADGRATQTELKAAYVPAATVWSESSVRASRLMTVEEQAASAAMHCSSPVGFDSVMASITAHPAARAQSENLIAAIVEAAKAGADSYARPEPDKWGDARQSQARLLRDVVGNPFRPAPTFDPAWRTTEVARLVQEIYDARSFERMPELADALQEAGCHDREILDHLRGPGSHVRGCWALDLVLGKD